ncbi:MAG TPA: SDR family oxidoreductase, partial [Pirellulaceae bacterium]
MKPYLLLIGATGFIGQYLLRRLLLRNIPVVVVVRGDSRDSARARVDAIVEKFEREEDREIARPICFTGDITKETLGLDEFAIEWFEGNCGSVLHNAASIRFHAPDGDRTKDPWLSNREGTRHVLDLCKLAGIEEFHHVSTAYVSGKRIHETFYENQLFCGQEFVNDYQASKAEAEKSIRESEFLRTKTFYRPALVVGDSRDGFTTAPDFGLYYYIQFNLEVMKRLRPPGETGTIRVPFRLRFTGNERRNIVTVDWVADMIVHILTHPEYHNQTYHLTPEKASS